MFEKRRIRQAFKQIDKLRHRINDYQNQLQQLDSWDPYDYFDHYGLFSQYGIDPDQDRDLIDDDLQVAQDQRYDWLMDQIDQLRDQIENAKNAGLTEIDQQINELRAQAQELKKY